METVKKFFLSLITDAQWDADGAKVAGWICLLIAAVGFFLGYERFDVFLYSGIGALTLKGTGEAIHG